MVSWADRRATITELAGGGRPVSAALRTRWRRDRLAPRTPTLPTPALHRPAVATHVQRTTL